MCGIAGIYNFRSQAPVDRSGLEQMTAILAHRGPDSGGLHLDGALGLGHRRLSILDLSERGRQPMATPDGRYVITYNGEVYNYIELRAELESRGYRFRSDTDTEVILALYGLHGARCLERLNGMFAFAVWDRMERRLFLARDRMGIKPLYYALTRDGIVFASEAKALFASGSITPEVAVELVDRYMSFGYLPGEETLFHGVRKLSPGCWLQADARGVESATYWELQFARSPGRTADETAEQLRELLLDAVRIHLRSDVPVGIFLSGGLDSSTTVALLAEAGCRDLKTFSVAYRDEPGFDETRYARLVADRFGTDHHVLYLDPDRFLGSIPDFVWYMDEPVTEAAAISLYHISRLLRESVTVALSGEGADELFAGYDIYRYMGWIESYRKLPAGLRRAALEPALRAIGGDKIRRYLRLAAVPLEERYLGVSLHDTGYKEILYTDSFRGAVGRSPNPLSVHFEKARGCDLLTRLLYCDLKGWLVDDLLIKADKMTMAHSVELRVPFLDHRVVEFAASIPSEMKIRGGEVKWILKRAMRDRLPREIVARRKVGFPTPLASMFRKDLSAYLKDLLLSPRSIHRSYFKERAVERLVEEHVQGARDHHKVLWQLVVLEEWHRQFIDDAGSRLRSEPAARAAASGRIAGSGSDLRARAPGDPTQSMSDRRTRRSA
jgi:asparagine synthase (glutamine-hydrolysing)